MKKRMVRLVLIIGVMMSIIFTGCSFGTKDDKLNLLTSEEVLKQITNGIDEPKQMDIDPDFFTDNYGIDKAILESYSVRLPIEETYVNECAVFQVKDKKDIDKVKEGIEKRCNVLEGIWSKYNKEQYSLVKCRKVIDKDKYVLFVISENADKIEENFEEMFK